MHKQPSAAMNVFVEVALVTVIHFTS